MRVRKKKPARLGWGVFLYVQAGPVLVRGKYNFLDLVPCEISRPFDVVPANPMDFHLSPVWHPFQPFSGRHHDDNPVRESRWMRGPGPRHSVHGNMLTVGDGWSSMASIFNCCMSALNN